MKVSAERTAELAEMRALLDAAKSTARKFAHANGLHVSETAKPASRLTKAHASNRFGCTEKDGAGRVSPNGNALRSYRKAPWDEDHLALAKELGVSPKALRAELSRAKKRAQD